jgi:predicted ATPase
MVMGISRALVGDIAEGRAQLDRVIALYDPAVHRPLATRFGHDVRMTALCWRALALWMLGYPEAALADMQAALKDAREIGHAATSMFALAHTTLTFVLLGERAVAQARADELVTLAESKGSLYWKSYGLVLRGRLLVAAGKAESAIPVTTAAIASMRSTGAGAYAPWYLTFLAEARAELGQFEDAWRCIAEATQAVDTTRERWCEADIHRTAGDIELMSPMRDSAKAEAHFQRALAVARGQQAKSFELRAAMSLARFWRDHGQRGKARELLASVYGQFTEGFETPALTQARALLDELAS